MTGPPQIFDRRLHRLRLGRAARSAVSGNGGAEFLSLRVAEDMAERLEAVNRRFDMALDLGARDGAFAEALAASTASGKIGHLTPVSETRGPWGGTTLVADAERLPFAEASVSLIVSRLALHWVNDLVGALIQVRRALKPDGLFLGALLGGATLTELRQSLMAAEAELRGGAGPRVSPFLDAADGASLLQRAGFALPVADTDTVRVLYDEPLKLLADLRAMGETSALLDRPKTPLTRDILRRTFEIYRARHTAPDGRIVATFEILNLTGWAPHPDQPKALRRGSAKMSLAEALKPAADPGPRA
jgi:SAM-dependent methyltransferase